MYKLSVPINIETVTAKTLPVFLTHIKNCDAQRVFVCGIDDICNIASYDEKLKMAIDFFKQNSIEIGVWINSFGHGGALSGVNQTNGKKYTQITGAMGEYGEFSNCPMDEQFSKDFCDGIKKLAKLNPDIIMLDDDFRLNSRSAHYMCCFCDLHIKEYYKRIDEEIPRDKLEELIFTGGKNKYRTEYMKLMGETMLNFSKSLRNSVDEINPSIRLGACTCSDNWDYNGTDSIALAKTLAGNTKPFIRTIGAPYWDSNIIGILEDTRLQINWSKNTGVEIFAEGDTYPRPRYMASSPSRPLELFDLALLADGTADGILKYIFDYTYKPDYEMGYVKGHIKNTNLRQQVKSVFADKKPVGVYSFNAMHKMENWVLPSEICSTEIGNRLTYTYQSSSREFLSKNSIPTSYDNSGYPAFVISENARYIDEEDLKNGAILDISAALILKERGIDTGIVSAETCGFEYEYFAQCDEKIRDIENNALKKIQCNPNAEVLSTFLPGETPASYLYENADGLRFLVLAHDLFSSDKNPSYINNYCRQAQLIDSVEWLCGKKLPAVCTKNPNLYILTSKGNSGMSVALINVFTDEITEPVIKLDKEYKEIKFVNCTGRLDGDTVYLSEIQPYGFAAFEIK